MNKRRRGQRGQKRNDFEVYLPLVLSKDLVMSGALIKTTCVNVRDFT